MPFLLLRGTPDPATLVRVARHKSICNGRKLMSARRRNLAALITAFLVTCAPALAGIVGPDAITYDDDLNIPSNAEVVATQDHPLTLNYTEGIPEGGTVIDDNSIEVTLHTRVLRDPLTQRLTFVYDLIEGDHDLLGGELSFFIMGNFG